MKQTRVNDFESSNIFSTSSMVFVFVFVIQNLSIDTVPWNQFIEGFGNFFYAYVCVGGGEVVYIFSLIMNIMVRACVFVLYSISRYSMHVFEAL